MSRTIMFRKQYLAYKLLGRPTFLRDEIPSGMRGMVIVMAWNSDVIDLRSYMEQNRDEWKKEIAEITSR